MNKGKYILIEGGDGSGKSTQTKMLGEYLQGKNIPFVRTREPGGTEISEILRDIVLKKRDETLTKKSELFSYLAARSQLICNIIKPNLEEGKWVICDRGYPSTVAYQGFGNRTDLELIRTLNRESITFDGEEIQPDLTIIIKVPVKTGLRKATQEGADRQESRGTDFHQRVLKGYEYYLTTDENAIEIPYIENNLEEMHKQIIEKIKERFNI